MTSEDIDLQYFQASEDTEDVKMKLGRLHRPTPCFSYTFSLICVGLLLVNIVLVIYRVPGSRNPQHTLENKSSALNDSVQCKVDRLTQGGEAKMLEMIHRLENSLQIIHMEASRNSQMVEKLQQMEGTLKMIQAEASKRSAEKNPDHNLEQSVGNIIDTIDRKLDQLTQHGSYIMERLRGLEESLTPIRIVPTSASRGKTYTLQGPKASYNEAVAMCGRSGGRLATPLNAAENDAIFAIRKLLNTPALLGIHDKHMEGTFRTESGQALAYSNWAQGEPNNAGRDEDCVTMLSTGKWNDVPCSYAYEVICEK